MSPRTSGALTFHLGENKMTRDQFVKHQDSRPLPVKLLDGRMGLCCHWNDTDIIVDAYRGNNCEQINVPFSKVRVVGDGALIQVA